MQRSDARIGALRSVADVYYVSNVGQLFVADGFISRIDPDATGDVSGDPDYVWISGLYDRGRRAVTDER